jgi:hypothetical protein
MRGCTLCAQQTIARFKGDDRDLVAAFEQAARDIEHWLETGEAPPGERPPSGEGI